MRIKYQQSHLSINKKFQDIEIPDFTVITGKNGVGKTHLLEGIAADKFIIYDNNNRSYDSNNIFGTVYFNYNDFIVKTTDNIDSKKAIKKNQYNQRINKDIDDIKQIITDNIIKPLQASPKNQHNQADIVLNAFLNNEVDFLGRNQLHGLFGKLYVNLGPGSRNLPDELYDRYHKAGKEIYTEYLKLINSFPRDEKFDKYYQLSKEKNIHLMQMQSKDLNYNESYIGEYLQLEFNNDLKKRQKQLNQKIYNPKNEQKTVDDIQKEINKELGIPPWEFLNSILKEYKYNDYLIDEDCILLDQGTDTGNIKLKNSKTNVSVDIEKLSSGEKTLFALVVTLYRQKKDGNLPDVLLLDEIDSPLHPCMCEKLLDVLQEVFMGEYKMKIILVTHSPSTVALAPENSVFLMENNNGLISLKSSSKNDAINFVFKGFVALEQGIKFFDQISKKDTCIISEGKNTKYLNKANNYYGSENIEIIQGVESKSGKSQLKTLFDFISRLPHNNKIYFVWDCDCNSDKKITKLKKTENTIPFIFDKNIDSFLKKGIENLFNKSLITDENRSRFYLNKRNEYGGNYEEFNKKEFEKFVCKEQNKKDDFVNFKPLFEKIKKEIDGNDNN